MSDQVWLQRAVDLGVRSVADGGGPFGAVIVRDGDVLAQGQNRVTRDLDPTAHAEVVAIRVACQQLGDFALAGCTLYASCEPCPMCVSAALWSRVDRVVYAADRHDAAAGGFDDREFYDLFDKDRSTWSMPVAQTTLEAGQDASRGAAFAPFEAWLSYGDRTDY